MPIDFDDSDLEDTSALDNFVESIVPQQRPAPAVQKKTEAQPVQASTSSLNKTMSEVEKRLELAKYYRLLLDDALFEGASAAARQVEEEIRGFVQERLRVLLNIEGGGTKSVEQQFSKEEALVLKAVAKNLLNRAGAPKVRKAPVEAPPPQPQPTPEPVTIVVREQPEAPKRPHIKRRKVDEPEQLEPVVSTHLKQESAPASMEIGSTFVENGKKYEIVLKDGKPFPKDVTKQAVSSTRKPLPMPQGEAFTALSSARAATEAQLVSAGVAASTGGALVNLALQQVSHKEDGIQLNG